MVPNIYDKNIVQIISPMNRNKMTKKQTSSLASNNSAFLFKLQIKNFHYWTKTFSSRCMHALLSNMPIHHIYICTQGTLEVTQIGSSLSQYFRPKILHRCTQSLPYWQRQQTHPKCIAKCENTFMFVR
jgi:hypothetical protein